MTFNVTGFSGFFVGSAGSSLLPLKLLSFSAVRNGETVLLTWKTTNEINVSHFEIERGDDGKNFVTIANKPAKGNTNQISNYEHVDNGVNKQTNFYRVKMVDMDGNFVYTKIVRVNSNVNVQLSAYPNPAIDLVVVTFPNTAKSAQLRIVDQQGRVMREIRDVKNGQQIVRVKGFSPGMYTIVWSDGVNILSQSLFIE